MVRKNLVTERIAIDSYREMIQYLGNEDPTTRRPEEEEHAEDMATLLDRHEKREDAGSSSSIR